MKPRYSVARKPPRDESSVTEPAKKVMSSSGICEMSAS